MPRATKMPQMPASADPTLDATAFLLCSLRSLPFEKALKKLHATLPLSNTPSTTPRAASGQKKRPSVDPSPSGTSGTSGTSAPPKRRGRPPGSRNRPKSSA